MSALQQERIETSRLALVPLEDDIARALLAGDLSVVRHAEGWPHADTGDALRMAVRSDEPWPVWLVEADGVVIGDCGAVGGLDENGEIDIGLGLAEEWRRRAHGAEIIGALAAWLLGRPGVRRVVARDVEAGNVASRRALERAGFVLERSDGLLVSYTFDHAAD